MRYRYALLAALLFAGVVSGPARAQVPEPKEESAEQLPAGPGRDETFGMCSACHAYKLVAAQAMSRERWEETIQLMVDKHGMPKLQKAQTDLMLDYLAKTHPPKKATGTGGFQIPFAPD